MFNDFGGEAANIPHVYLEEIFPGACVDGRKCSLRKVLAPEISSSADNDNDKENDDDDNHDDNNNNITLPPPPKTTNIGNFPGPPGKTYDGISNPRMQVQSDNMGC